MSIRFVSIVEAKVSSIRTPHTSVHLVKNSILTKNYPVFFHSFSVDSQSSANDSAQSLNQQFIAEMALDFVETLTRVNRSETVALLLVHDEVAVYGSLANTGVKVLVGVDALSESTLDVEPLMKAIQEAYVAYTCNPFYDETKLEIKSKSFQDKIGKLVNETQPVAEAR